LETKISSLYLGKEAESSPPLPATAEKGGEKKRDEI